MSYFWHQLKRIGFVLVKVSFLYCYYIEKINI